MDEYENVVRGSLRLKGVSDNEIKKKKKKQKKEKAKEEKRTEKQPTKAVVITKTKAQLKFEQMKEEQLKKRILEKASKTHKERVEEFNRHLDNLTEHFDIPKVSWTK
uniref:EOG090X0P1V n=1 Tax=Lynceus sp. MCZ IZ 141354 TaxID=1930659 RepID=A0A9N6ZGC5_9CRUS|nr:EOG090X0P1V [Lynceus sp. MCZ IZ 141354]